MVTGPGGKPGGSAAFAAAAAEQPAHNGHSEQTEAEVASQDYGPEEAPIKFCSMGDVALLCYLFIFNDGGKIDRNTIAKELDIESKLLDERIDYLERERERIKTGARLNGNFEDASANITTSVSRKNTKGSPARQRPRPIAGMASPLFYGAPHRDLASPLSRPASGASLISNRSFYEGQFSTIQKEVDDLREQVGLYEKQFKEDRTGRKEQDEKLEALATENRKLQSNWSMSEESNKDLTNRIEAASKEIAQLKGKNRQFWLEHYEDKEHVHKLMKENNELRERLQNHSCDDQETETLRKQRELHEETVHQRASEIRELKLQLKVKGEEVTQLKGQINQTHSWTTLANQQEKAIERDLYAIDSQKGFDFLPRPRTSLKNFDQELTDHQNLDEGPTDNHALEEEMDDHWNPVVGTEAEEITGRAANIHGDLSRTLGEAMPFVESPIQEYFERPTFEETNWQLPSRITRQSTVYSPKSHRPLAGLKGSILLRPSQSPTAAGLPNRVAAGASSDDGKGEYLASDYPSDTEAHSTKSAGDANTWLSNSPGSNEAQPAGPASSPGSGSSGSKEANTSDGHVSKIREASSSSSSSFDLVEAPQGTPILPGANERESVRDRVDTLISKGQGKVREIYKDIRPQVESLRDRLPTGVPFSRRRNATSAQNVRTASQTAKFDSITARPKAADGGAIQATEDKRVAAKTPQSNTATMDKAVQTDDHGPFRANSMPARPGLMTQTITRTIANKPAQQNQGPQDDSESSTGPIANSQPDDEESSEKLPPLYLSVSPTDEGEFNFDAPTSGGWAEMLTLRPGQGDEAASKSSGTLSWVDWVQHRISHVLVWLGSLIGCIANFKVKVQDLGIKKILRGVSWLPLLFAGGVYFLGWQEMHFYAAANDMRRQMIVSWRDEVWRNEVAYSAAYRIQDFLGIDRLALG